MPIIDPPSRRADRNTLGREATRPERFAWDEEECLVLSGIGPHGHVCAGLKARQQRREEDQEKRSRILLAGRRNREFDDLHCALEAARDAVRDRFVIIERSGQYYMQCLCMHAGWILEKREGHEGAHFRAMATGFERAGNAGDDPLLDRLFPDHPVLRLYLDFDQVLSAMEAYHQRKPEPDWLGWERIDVA